MKNKPKRKLDPELHEKVANFLRLAVMYQAQRWDMEAKIEEHFAEEIETEDIIKTFAASFDEYPDALLIPTEQCITALTT